MTFIQMLTAQALAHELDEPSDTCIFCKCPMAVHTLRKYRKPILGFIGRVPVRRIAANITLRCMECAYQKQTGQVVCFTHPAVGTPAVSLLNHQTDKRRI